MKLAIIDLDGVIANAEARFAAAELAKEQWLMERQKGLPYAVDQRVEKSATDVYWRAVFNPANVPLDTLIDGAREALNALRASRPLIVLTSRPEAMRGATVRWLVDHDILFFAQHSAALIMKPSAFQYTKTTVWKAGMIQHLAQERRAEEVLVIDDEQVNRETLAQYTDTFTRLIIVESLAQAVRYIKDGVVTAPDLLEDDHPF